MKDTKAEAILKNWSKELYKNSASINLKDLVYLMQVQGIDTLVYSGYTPSFNDGDICEHKTLFIGPPNCLYDYIYIYLDKNGQVCSIYEHEDWEDIKDDMSILDSDTVLALQDWVENDNPERLIRNKEYPLPGFDKYLESICNLLFKTNFTVVIKLVEGELVFQFADTIYEEDY